jgi:ABC-type transporter Mla subunit MlaD
MSWLWWVQIGADVLLVGGLLVLLNRLKASGGEGVSAPKEMQNFLAEGQRLSQEFDRLLGEKRELVGTTLTSLDNRIGQLKAMVEDLEERLKQARQALNTAQDNKAGAQEAQAAPSTGSGSQNTGQPLDDFRKKVLKLARQGKAPAQIAEATGRPRGEVELVLGLSGRS